MSYDNTCKYLAENYPCAFVRWLLEIEPQNIEILKTELSLDPIYADSVTFLNVANFILHLEFQTKPQSFPPMPLRMLDYWVRLKRQYDCGVIQIVIFLQQTSNEIAYTEVFQEETTTHRYRVIRMWEQDSTLFLDNPGLLPLAPLTKSDSPQGLLARVAERIGTIEDNFERAELTSCTQLLAGLRFDKDFVYQFLGEELMRESSVYQDIWQRAGKQKEEGLILRQLNRRLGQLEPSLLEQIKELSIEELDALGEALLDFSSIPDLSNWLSRTVAERN